MSVALLSGDRFAQRTVAQRRSSDLLLRLVDECLEELQFNLQDLDGIVALRGPGSFTGLRIGLATAYGIHQSLDIPAIAISTLEILALSIDGGDRVVGAAVDAIRGEWFGQCYRSGKALNDPKRLPAETLASTLPADHWVGFGLDKVFLDGTITFQPPPRSLALVAAEWARDSPPAWDAETLLSPSYLRAPLVNRPGAPKRVSR